MATSSQTAPPGRHGEDADFAIAGRGGHMALPAVHVRSHRYVSSLRRKPPGFCAQISLGKPIVQAQMFDWTAETTSSKDFSISPSVN